MGITPNSLTLYMGQQSAYLRKTNTICCALVTIYSLKSLLLDTMPIVFAIFASL